MSSRKTTRPARSSRSLSRNVRRHDRADRWHRTTAPPRSRSRARSSRRCRPQRNAVTAWAWPLQASPRRPRGPPLTTAFHHSPVAELTSAKATKLRLPATRGRPPLSRDSNVAIAIVGFLGILTTKGIVRAKSRCALQCGCCANRQRPRAGCYAARSPSARRCNRSAPARPRRAPARCRSRSMTSMAGCAENASISCRRDRT